MCPPAARPIMNHSAMWSGTYYSFTSDEPCACYLVYQLYLTCLYLPFAPEHCLYKFPPVFRFSACASPHWWASSSDTLIYPFIFTFPLLPLHCQSTMHPHTDMTTCNCTCTCFIRPISLIWWTHVLLIFLVILMCTFLQSDQSWALALCSQALTIASLSMSLMLSFLFAIRI